jgi:menaquinone-dependent protoporphyrinogen oxidase
MDGRVLVTYHSVEGQAERIANRIASDLEREGLRVDVRAVVRAPDPTDYGGVVVGDSIHSGRHSQALTQYLGENRDALSRVPSALFQVSLTSANPDEEHTATAMGMVDELLQHTGFQPGAVGLFAGRLAYTKYGWLKRKIMRRIVRGEGGDTDTSRDWEYTDWDAVDRFAAQFATRLGTSEAAAGQG